MDTHKDNSSSTSTDSNKRKSDNILPSSSSSSSSSCRQPNVMSSDNANISSNEITNMEREETDASNKDKSDSSSEDTLTKQIKDEHRIWTYNALILYDNVMCHTAEWPSLTVQWLPGLNQKGDGETGQNLLVGTHTSDDYPNYVLILEVSLPTEKIPSRLLRYDFRNDYEGFGFGDDAAKKFNVTARIPHRGEVNRALYLPQKSTIIASRGVEGSVYIFDSSKFGPDILSDISVEDAPEIILKGHQAEGWGMAWNESRAGVLATVADDGHVCIWDINHSITNGKRECEPVCSFAGHQKPAQDICWRKDEGAESTALTVGDEGHLAIWDLREDCRRCPPKAVQLSNLPLNTISVNSLKTNIVAVGGCDQEIYICDLRRLDVPVHRMSSHTDAVIRIHWSEFKEGVLASASSDRFISIWDTERVGMEQAPEDAEDGPPELIFSHGGHTAAVSDFSWNPEEFFQWTIASVSEDNGLHIWKPSRAAFEDMEMQSEESDDEDDDDFPVE